MTIIRTIPDDEATGRVAEHYADDIRDQGYVAEHSRVMLLNPAAYDAWENLLRAIVATMDVRRYELITLAAARGARSRHCRLAHGRKTLRYIEEPQLVRIARDYRDADLTAAEVAMMAFAERVSGDASSMTDDDSRVLRDHGFDDAEIVNIALAAAARNYYSRAIQALGVAVEEPPGLSAELAGALVAGI